MLGVMCQKNCSYSSIFKNIIVTYKRYINEIIEINLVIYVALQVLVYQTSPFNFEALYYDKITPLGQVA